MGLFIHIVQKFNRELAREILISNVTQCTCVTFSYLIYQRFTRKLQNECYLSISIFKLCNIHGLKLLNIIFKYVEY
jgi:hypothetical protein